jgi:predicted HicB family RNase H-like nuclease
MSRKLSHDDLLYLRVSSTITARLEEQARTRGMSVPELVRLALRREVMGEAA